MNADQAAIAKTCLNAAHAGSMDFPAILDLLGRSGFDGYLIDYRRNTATYYGAAGDSVVLDMPAAAQPVATAFDAQGVAGQVRWAQAAAPDYSYDAFCRNVQTMGCAGYLVSLIGRRVVYFGRTGETHIEVMP